jgi:hypothetical protein
VTNDTVLSVTTNENSRLTAYDAMLINKQSLFIWRNLSVQGPSIPKSIAVMETMGTLNTHSPPYA